MALIGRHRNLTYRSECAFCDWRPMGRIGHGRNLLLDLGCEAEHAHDLGNPGPGDSLSSGDFGLVADLAGLEVGLPLHGLLEEPDHLGGLGGN
ncbi:hypothetical protein ACFL6M_06195 [Candidatus Eisenbacteria bacterium]|uniref:Uncharacterized protein n=1 Tax=Eiseniibacteriota bacterium TaxID=2212470 RepID=A0ABV6YLG8_UNCEI